MHITSTIALVVAFFASLAAWWFALRASADADFAEKEAKRCDKRANELVEALARLHAVEGELKTLGSQHRRLSGRFYKHLDQIALNDPGDDFARDTPARPAPSAAPFCANYGQAQVEGPTSPAARCECAYCAEMRLRREQFRSEVLPKTNSERHDAAKAGLEGRRYERE